MASYNEEMKKKIVRLHLQNGRSLKSLSDEFSVSKSGISIWLKNYREECQINADTNQEYDLMAENLRLKKQLEEMENRFLHNYCNEAQLYAAVSDFAYLWYNLVRPLSYNGGLHPSEKRAAL